MTDVSNWSDATMEGGDNLRNSVIELQGLTVSDVHAVKSTDDLVKEIHDKLFEKKGMDYGSISTGLTGVVSSIVSNYGNMTSDDPTDQAIGCIGVITSVGQLASLAGPVGVIVAGLLKLVGTLISGILSLFQKSRPVPPSLISQIIKVVAAAEDETILLKLSEAVGKVVDLNRAFHDKLTNAINGNVTVDYIGTDWMDPKETLFGVINIQLRNRMNGNMDGSVENTGDQFYTEGARYLYDCTVLASHLRELLTLHMWAHMHNKSIDHNTDVHDLLTETWTDLDEKIKTMLEYFHYPHGTTKNMKFYRACWQLESENKRVISALGDTVDMTQCAITVLLETRFPSETPYHSTGFVFSDPPVKSDHFTDFPGMYIKHDAKTFKDIKKKLVEKKQGVTDTNKFPVEAIFQLLPLNPKSCDTPFVLENYCNGQPFLIFSMGTPGYMKRWWYSDVDPETTEWNIGTHSKVKKVICSKFDHDSNFYLDACNLEESGSGAPAWGTSASSFLYHIYNSHQNQMFKQTTEGSGLSFDKSPYTDSNLTVTDLTYPQDLHALVCNIHQVPKPKPTPKISFEVARIETKVEERIEIEINHTAVVEGVVEDVVVKAVDEAVEPETKKIVEDFVGERERWREAGIADTVKTSIIEHIIAAEARRDYESFIQDMQRSLRCAVPLENYPEAVHVTLDGAVQQTMYEIMNTKMLPDVSKLFKGLNLEGLMKLQRLQLVLLSEVLKKTLPKQVNVLLDAINATVKKAGDDAKKFTNDEGNRITRTSQWPFDGWDRGPMVAVSQMEKKCLDHFYSVKKQRVGATDYSRYGFNIDRAAIQATVQEVVDGADGKALRELVVTLKEEAAKK